ncbi:MAG: methyltransferase domain-containing protein [Bacteroidetes bacterium]|nr:methyltransferase domain-containing protein [Bacteroidota bacterium]
MKKIIRDVFRKFGLEVQFINKSTDEDLYRKLYPIDSLSKLRFYNIGAGDFQHPCWTNVDGKSEWYQNYFDVNKIGIQVDLFAHEQFPIEDNTAELVYTSHTIEHIDDHSVQFLFDDAYRFLKKDGVIRIVTVNSDTAFNAWQRKDRNYFFGVNGRAKIPTMKVMELISL